MSDMEGERIDGLWNHDIQKFWPKDQCMSYTDGVPAILILSTPQEPDDG